MTQTTTGALLRGYHEALGIVLYPSAELSKLYEDISTEHRGVVVMVAATGNEPKRIRDYLGAKSTASDPQFVMLTRKGDSPPAKFPLQGLQGLPAEDQAAAIRAHIAAVSTGKVTPYYKVLAFKLHHNLSIYLRGTRLQPR